MQHEGFPTYVVSATTDLDLARVLVAVTYTTSSAVMIAKTTSTKPVSLVADKVCLSR